MLREIKSAARLLKWNNVRARRGLCPLCGLTVFIKLDDDEMAVRCVRCRASSVTISFVSVLKVLVPDLKSRHVYELSSQGPLVRYLSKQSGRLTLSEFFDDIPAGHYKGNVQCQDVQNLKFQNASFDICTSIEVFEHVADDVKGFRELHRVLKPEGMFLFTVPNLQQQKTVERAKVVGGRVLHFLPAEYHGDRFRGNRGVLCFRNYGMDILERLLSAGFSKASAILGEDPSGWGFSRKVLVRHK